MTALEPAWATVVVRVAPDDVDLVSGLLWDAGVAGVEERGLAAEGLVELRAGVPADDAGQVAGALAARADVVVEAAGGAELLDRWRAWARPWRAGSRLVVVPAWQDRPDWLGSEDLALTIDPGRAFGSGGHPTTRMCLAELEHLVEPSSAVADVGSGSGVLAVAAARLGAELVVAVDIDPEAVRATGENAARNGVERSVAPSATPADQLEAGAYDVVVANIGAATLVDLAPALARALAPGGTVVLSGLLGCQADTVLAAFRAQQLELAGTAVADDWRTLLLRRT